jgi:hypothetical protein
MQVVFDTTSPSRDAEFWRQLLDLEYPHGIDPSEDDCAESDWLNLSSRDRTRRLAFQQVEALRTTTWPDSEVPQQLHLDLAVGTVDDLNELARRALALGGAELLDRRHDDAEPLVVLADPSGHPFCVFVGPA